MSKTVFLEDVCDILDSQRVPVTSKKRKKGIYPYYGANGIQDYVDDYIFDDELVLLAEDGGNFGSKDKPIAYRVSGKCWINNHAHVLKAKECIDVNYLCYSLMFYDVTSLVNGATRQKLNQSAMRKMLIPLPEKREQLEIVNNLDKVSHTIDLCKAILEKLDLLVKARFVEMFGDVKINSMHYDVIQLDKIANVGSSKRVFVEELQKSGVPFYRGTEIGALAEGKVITPELFITMEHYEELKSATGVPNIGDLLMPSICSDGRIWLVDTKEPFYFKDGRVLWVHPISDSIDSIYLLHFLKQKIAVDYDSIASGTTFSELKIFALKGLKIIIPSKTLQNQFASFVEQTEKSKAVVKQVKEKAETLKKKLMQDYFE